MESKQSTYLISAGIFSAILIYSSILVISDYGIFKEDNFERFAVLSFITFSAIISQIKYMIQSGNSRKHSAIENTNFFMVTSQTAILSLFLSVVVMALFFSPLVGKLVFICLFGYIISLIVSPLFILGSIHNILKKLAYKIEIDN